MEGECYAWFTKNVAESIMAQTPYIINLQTVYSHDICLANGFGFLHFNIVNVDGIGKTRVDKTNLWV